MMNLIYECSDSTLIDLMAAGIYAQEPESLISSKWSYNTISGVNGIAKIKKFYKDIQELPLKLDIMATDEEEFNRMMELMHSCFTKDILRNSPGKIWWNDYYKEIFVVEESYEEFDEMFESIEKDLTILSINQNWIKSTLIQFCALEETNGTLDYGSEGFYVGFDLGSMDVIDSGYDYDQAEYADILNNECIGSANFKIIFYGPVENPSITIGNHEYELLISLEEGEYATVDSITKKIMKYDINGEAENIFYARNKESYIFEKIPEGIVSVLRDQETAIDVYLFDERGEPRWI